MSKYVHWFAVKLQEWQYFGVRPYFPRQWWDRNPYCANYKFYAAEGRYRIEIVALMGRYTVSRQTSIHLHVLQSHYPLLGVTRNNNAGIQRCVIAKFFLSSTHNVAACPLHVGGRTHRCGRTCIVPTSNVQKDDATTSTSPTPRQRSANYIFAMRCASSRDLPSACHQTQHFWIHNHLAVDVVAHDTERQRVISEGRFRRFYFG